MKRDAEWNIFLKNIKYLNNNAEETSGGKRNHKTKEI